ncbi:MAG: hypothetical protein ACKVU1_15075 [bacterium]
MRGYRVVTSLFDEIDSPSLLGLVVFLPMVSGDDEAAARERTLENDDARIATSWDPGRGVGRAFRATLGLRSTAWDVYLVYPPGVTWDGVQPPAPRAWMHQLSELAGARPEEALEAETLRDYVLAALPAAARRF